jgi:Phosphotransferase enzyme family
VSAPLLAADAAVPQRDVLLDRDAVADLLADRLLGGRAVGGCERRYAKYRVGHSLRVVYEFSHRRRRHHVAARTFAAGTSAAAFERTQPVVNGPLAPVVHVPELDTVLWTFPNDRRLSTLPLLTGRSPALDRLVGRPIAATRLVAYAAERSASAQCLDEGGRVLAYAKVMADGGAGAERRVLEAISSEVGAGDADLGVPRVIGTSELHSAVAVEPVAGRRLDGLDRDALAPALGRLGAALAALHGVRPLPGHRFERLDTDRLTNAVSVIARARPQDGPAAAELLAALLSRAQPWGPPAHLHGDVNPRNAILDGRRIVLIDMEHAAAGPAAADLGQVLAGLLLAQSMGATGGPAPADALVAGYATRSPAPDPRALRWFTAACILARCALPAVNRVRPLTLLHLRPALDAARGLLT